MHVCTIFAFDNVKVSFLLEWPLTSKPETFLSQVIFNAERHSGARLEGLRRSRRQEITQTLAEGGVARP